MCFPQSEALMFSETLVCCPAHFDHSQLDHQLGSSLEENWGLDTLVRVGETWLPRMLEAGATQQQQKTQRASQASSSGSGSGAQPTGADVPLLKLFEFLTASMCLYVIEEHSSGSAHTGVWTAEEEEDSIPRWWTVKADAPDPDPVVAPLLQRTLHILLTSLELRIPMAWKSVQLSVVMLWNAAVQSREC